MELHELARQVAQTIVDNDTGAYLVALNNAGVDTWNDKQKEQLALAVDSVCDTLTPSKQIKVIYHK